MEVAARPGTASIGKEDIEKIRQRFGRGLTKDFSSSKGLYRN